jgi:hypothetical protein
MRRGLILGVWVVWVGAAVGQTGKADVKAEAPLKPGEWESRSADGKLQRVTLLDDTVSLETAFGTLKIPIKEVRRIEFGLRYTDAERKRIADAVADITAADARTREKGKDALLEYGAKAYPLVVRMSKKLQTNPHLIQVLDKLAATIPEADGDLRDYDLVLTADDSKLSGKLPDAIRVKAEDAEKALKWADTRVLVNGGSAAIDEKIEIVNLTQIGGIPGLARTHFDKVVGVEITGRVGGSVWGTGVYTTDSDPGSAAVHAGVLAANETAVVKVRVKADAGGYQGSTQNGVTSNNWGPYQGCYEFLGKHGKKK